jgi:hypothetical protein
MDLASRGAIGAALRELEIARASLDAHEQARSEVFRIGILWYAGKTTDSLTGTDRALETLRGKGDAFWEAQLLRNRGGLLAERGDATAAEPDLVRARDLFAGIGATAAAFAMEGQLARIACTRGDLPGCLALLDAIDIDQLAAGVAAEHELLRAQALTTAQLWSEALQALEQAQAIWKRSARDDHEGRLELVRLTLLAGDPLQARALALHEQRSFASQQRRLYAARASGLALAATIAARRLGQGAVRSGRHAAATLAAAGWTQEARRVQLSVARAAIELGMPRVARRELATCAGLRRHGPVADRVEAWHVDALVRLAEGDRLGAQRAARTGLRLLEEHQAALAASDLRAAVSEIGVEIARLGLRIALADDAGDSVLAWAERLRASALRLAPVTPPERPELRALATELRRVSAAIGRGERARRSERGLLARQATLEVSIRRLSRHATAQALAATVVPGRRELVAALGDGALVELIELDGVLTALTLVAGRLARHELGEVAPVHEELEWLRFALNGLVRRGQTPAQRASALAGARASAVALEQRLIAPLLETIGQRRLVIVPTGSLHTLPWSMLSPLRGRPVIVAPSAAVWLARQASPRRGSRRRAVALVAGPRLRHATAELADIGRLYPRVTVLAGRQATANAVLSALEGTSIAHLACHGRFRSDSPLFSSLELADGPLNVYELQRLRRPPELVVLSACDLAISDTRPGDELLGVAAALIGMGTRTVIASVVPVPDAAAKRLMIALHAHLRTGHSPAVALAKAQQALRPRESPLAGFLCMGTD